MKLLLVLLSLVSLNSSAQEYSQEVKRLDSLTKIIDETYREDIVRKDTGILLGSNPKSIGRYKYYYFFNKIDSTLRLVVKNYISDSTSVTQESFYYWHNKPITAYRMEVLKTYSREDTFYFINEKLFEKTKEGLIPSIDGIKYAALENLKTYTKP